MESSETFQRFAPQRYVTAMLIESLKFILQMNALLGLLIDNVGSLITILALPPGAWTKMRFSSTLSSSTLKRLFPSSAINLPDFNDLELKDILTSLLTKHRHV